MSRSATAIGVGLLIGALTIMVVQLIGHALIPLPAGVEASEPESVATAVPAIPLGVYVFWLVAWAAGTMHGAGFAAHLAYKSRILHGMIVGGVLLAFAAWDLIVLWQNSPVPPPAWFAIIGVLQFPVSAWLGALIGTQPLPGHREGWIVKEPPNYSKSAAM